METIENITVKHNIKAKGRADFSSVLKVLIMQSKYIYSS